MEANFSACLKKVLVHEGGFSNHPADPGGATMKGVTQRVYTAYRLGKNLPDQSVRWINNGELEDIYKRQYWDAVRGDELPSGVDYCIFDAAVNSGPIRAIRWLQSALEVKADGIFGIVTKQAVERFGPANLIRRYCASRLGWLKLLNTWPVFGKGWGRRVTEVERDALKMI